MAIIEETQFFVSVAGTDVSTRWASRLIKIWTIDNSGEVADTCGITLDDSGGQIALPDKGAAIVIALGPKDGATEVVFDGIVDDVKSDNARGSGMTVEIQGKTADTRGKQKSKRNKHWDDTTVGKAMKDAGQFASVQLSVCPRIDQLKRKYIAQDGESFLHFVQRLARECGGTFKMIGGVRGVVLDRNSGQTVGGGSIGTVVARRDPDNSASNNIITWSISPLLTRPRYRKIKSRYYDKKAAKWVEKEVEVKGSENDEQAQADDLSAYSGNDDDDTEQSATGSALESERNKGVGEIKIDGNAAARAEGTLTVVGTRPGVDGDYVMNTVSHDFDRESGWITTIELRRPDTKGGDKRAVYTGMGDAERKDVQGLPQ
jgi:uncharacterized protein